MLITSVGKQTVPKGDRLCRDSCELREPKGQAKTYKVKINNYVTVGTDFSLSELRWLIVVFLSHSRVLLFCFRRRNFFSVFFFRFVDTDFRLSHHDTLEGNVVSF